MEADGDDESEDITIEEAKLLGKILSKNITPGIVEVFAEDKTRNHTGKNFRMSRNSLYVSNHYFENNEELPSMVHNNADMVNNDTVSTSSNNEVNETSSNVLDILANAAAILAKNRK